MQNNNSKLNTVLLIIVIILLAIGIWMLSVNEKVVDRIESDTETSVVEDGDVKEEEPEVVQPKPVDPTITFLKGLVSIYPNSEIKECHWADGKQFILNKNTMIADAPIYIYSSTGALMDTCSTFYDPETYTPSAYCQAIPAGCTSVIYNSTVDNYNLN